MLCNTIERQEPPVTYIGGNVKVKDDWTAHFHVLVEGLHYSVWGHLGSMYWYNHIVWSVSDD